MQNYDQCDVLRRLVEALGVSYSPLPWNIYSFLLFQRSIDSSIFFSKKIVLALLKIYLKFLQSREVYAQIEHIFVSSNLWK